MARNERARLHAPPLSPSHRTCNQLATNLKPNCDLMPIIKKHQTRALWDCTHLLICYPNKRQCSHARVWLSYENNGFGGCARPIWFFLSVKPYRKSTPGGRWCSPLQAKPAHIIALCIDSKGKRTSKTSTAEAFPLPPFCYALPAVLFWRPALTEHGAHLIA